MSEIIDLRKRKLQGVSQPREKTAKAVIFVSDDAETWSPLKPEEVPEAIKNPETMGWMMEGDVVETTESRYYMAERIN